MNEIESAFHDIAKRLSDPQFKIDSLEREVKSLRAQLAKTYCHYCHVDWRTVKHRASRIKSEDDFFNWVDNRHPSRALPRVSAASAGAAFDRFVKTGRYNRDLIDHGIYCLYDNREIVYVGKGNIGARITRHIKDGKQFDQFHSFPIRDDREALDAEYLLIDLFKPRYNKK